MERITIVLPVHNGGQYLRQALDSVFQQSYPHFEVIVLENASQDNTREILTSYADERLKIVASDEFLSIEQNWARVDQLELQPYLTFLSHDDVLHPTFLEEIKRLIVEYPQASLYTTHFRLIDADGKFLRLCKPVPMIESAEAFLYALQQHQRDSFGTGYVMRSADFRAVGGFPKLPRLIFADDLLFYLVAQRGYKICASDVHFDYRYHRSSVAQTTGLEAIFQAGVEYLERLQKKGYLDIEAQDYVSKKYVKDLLIRQHRGLLLNLTEQATLEKLQDYQQNVEKLRSDPRWMGEGDLLVRGFQLLLTLPSPIRLLILRGLRSIAKLTWYLRN